MLGWFAEQPGEVQVALIGMIGAVAVALIQFWKGKPTDKPRAAEVAAALVDNRAIDRLAEAVEDLTKEVHSTKGAASRMTDQFDRALKDLGDEVSKLRDELIRRKG